MGNSQSQDGDGFWTEGGQIGHLGLEKGKEIKAKHLAQVNSKKHAFYPKKLDQYYDYAYWRGIQVSSG